MATTERVNSVLAMFVEADPTSLDSLTDRQFRFVSLLFAGETKMDAYRAAYRCPDMAYEEVASCSSRLARNPYVIAKLVALRDQTDRQSTLSASLSRNFVINGLMRLATTATKETVQLGAYQALGKTVGIDLFRDVHVTEHTTRTVEDVEQELKQKLDALRDGLTIDGSSRPVTDDRSKATNSKDRRRKPKT